VIDGTDERTHGLSSTATVLYLVYHRLSYTRAGDRNDGAETSRSTAVAETLPAIVLLGENPLFGQNALLTKKSEKPSGFRHIGSCFLPCFRTSALMTLFWVELFSMD